MWPFIVTNDPDLMTLPVGLATVKDAYGVQYASPWPPPCWPRCR